MKLVRYADSRGSALGVVKNDGVIDLSKYWLEFRDDMIALIEMWPKVAPAFPKLVADSAPDVALADVRLLAPVSRPGKILAIGLNYGDHIKRPASRRRLIRSGSPKR
jgi:2-keto-4-pentenoate hydratase/2-oxohepta-3-ene-1,7-dioic acid hydratase in catechol pathway